MTGTIDMFGATPEVRPLFSYYGGKWRDAVKNYPAPTHDVLIEPFAGSAGYALRYARKRVMLFDLDENIVQLWRYLISVSSGEILRLPDLGPGQTVSDLDVTPEAAILIGFWLNKGCATPRKSPSAWMRSGVRPGSFWGAEVRQRIAAGLGFIRHWTVEQRSFEDIDFDAAASWFIDPPYQAAGKWYRLGSERINFDDLARWCLARQGQIIVCENDGADWLPFEPLANVKTARSGRRSSESVFIMES